MDTFKREIRYTVIKRKDLNEHQRYYLDAYLLDFDVNVVRDPVVIEKDWPEFEPVWTMLEYRVTGIRPLLPTAPRYLMHESESDRYLPPLEVVPAAAYDAALNYTSSIEATVDSLANAFDQRVKTIAQLLQELEVEKLRSKQLAERLEKAKSLLDTASLKLADFRMDWKEEPRVSIIQFLEKEAKL